MKFNFVFNRKGKLNAKGQALVQLRIHHQGTDLYLSTGIYLKPDHWDQNKQKVKSHSDVIPLNLKLSKLQRRALEYYQKAIDSSTPVSAKEVQSFLRGKDYEKFSLFVENELNGKRDLEPGTLKQHRVLLKYLKQFDEERGTMFLKGLSYDRVIEFQKWLGIKDNYRGGNLSVNYITSLLAIFRQYTKEAIRQNKLSIDPFNQIRLKKTKKERVFLTSEELEQIEGIDASNMRGKAAQTLDMFLFACYTGLRIIDLKQIKINNLIREETGLRLTFTPQKTKKSGIVVKTPLRALFQGKPEKIALKWSEGKSQNDLIFGHLDTNTYNDWLKVFCDKVKITKKISSHAGRHTFAMSMLDKGVPLEVLKELMGHTSITTTEIYARMQTSRVDSILKNINW